MMLAGVTLVESRGRGAWIVCVVSSRHRIEWPYEESSILIEFMDGIYSIEYMIQGSWSLIRPRHPSITRAGRHPGSFSWASTPPPDSKQHDANLDKDDEFIWLPPWKLGTLCHDGCHHHLLGELYIIRSISWRGGNHSKRSWADQLVWTRLGFSRQKSCM